MLVEGLCKVVAKLPAAYPDCFLYRSTYAFELTRVAQAVNGEAIPALEHWGKTSRCYGL